MMLTIESVSNPVWGDAGHTCFSAMVKFEEFSEPIPFSANPEDTEEHGRDIFAAGLNGDYGPIAAAPAAVQEVPPTISDRQFFQQLAVAGLISQQEALTAVMNGTLPAAFETFISQLPADQQFPARMSLSGATEFRRDHPLVAAFGAMQGMTSGQIDDLWRAAYALN